MSIFGSSGVRAVPDREFLRLALDMGLALGCENPSFVVGCDTRTSGDALKSAFVSGLLSAGARVHDAGILPTPALAYAARHFDAGAMITASHNPPEYNGIKLFNPDGSGFGHNQRSELEQRIFGGALPTAPWEEMQSVAQYPSWRDDYVKRILHDFPCGLRAKVVVDCGCGAASLTTPYVLRQLGCDVIGIHCYPSGVFPRGSEPTEENLSTLADVVKCVGADVGLAHDGDADRLAVIDETGRMVAGDRLQCLLALSLGAKTLVTTVDASQTVDVLGFEVTRTKVGDAFVSERLKDGGDFGGEPCGAFIFPGVSYCPDGVYAAAKVVEIACRGRLSTQLQRIPSYPTIRGTVPCRGPLDIRSIADVLARTDSPSISFTDGVRVAFKDGWLLVRPSGTEPKIRLTAEATTESRARELYDLGAGAVARCLEVGRV